MRSRAEVALVLQLVQVGWNDSQIARETGIPRRTIRTGDTGGRRTLTVSARGSTRMPGAALSAAVTPSSLPQPTYTYLLERKIELVPWQQELVDLDPRPLVRGLLHSD